MSQVTAARGGSPRAWIIALAALTASCGGDGGGSSPPPAPINHAPSFTSATSASVAENTTGSVYTAAATDADGDTVSFTLSGSDAAAFTLSGGVLSLANPLNFDRPIDANTDNSYDVTITASDGRGGSSSLALKVAVTNDHEGVSVARIATGLGTDALMAPRERTGGLIVASQDGNVQLVDGATGALVPVGNAFRAGEKGRVLAIAERAFIGVAMLDIDGRGVFVRTIPLADAHVQSLEVRIAEASTSTPRPRGTLFVDGGRGFEAALGDPSGTLAQDPASGYGKLFAIQVDPYCGASVYSYCLSVQQIGDGFQAPVAGGAFRTQSFVVDRGSDQQNEISLFNQDARPLDFGWPYREGTFARVTDPPAAIVGPSLTYAFGDGFFAGAGVTGGALYTGSIASLTGKVLLSDQVGKIFVFPASFLTDGILHQASEMENRFADFAPQAGTIERPVAIVCDRGGRLFVLDGDGELYATT